jgi:N6-adenosine-specific RNA methylase IME4
MYSDVFTGLQLRHYGALSVDPPWPFRIYAGNDTTPHRTDEEPYKTMTLTQLGMLPVASLAAPDCALFMWVVDPLLPQALEIGRVWGFTYKTRAFEWLKQKLNGDGYAIGMGYWSRKQCESCLLFTRGSPRRQARDVRQIIEEPRREHSRKPDEAYRRIEQLVNGPYAELFATRPRDGWNSWGDQL